MGGYHGSHPAYQRCFDELYSLLTEGKFKPLIDYTVGFDDLGDETDYTYTIVHCDRDWIPTDIPFNEYADGWEQERIREFAYSAGTRIPYTHYWLRLPNQFTRWKLSGNYALKIFDEYDDEEPVIVRRFMVVDRQVVVYPQVIQPRGADVYNTAQELNVDVRINKGVKISRPQMEISLT